MIKEESSEDATVDDGTVSRLVEEAAQPQHTPSDVEPVKGELVPGDHYKSTAMVKFSQVQPVSHFSRIELQTDLRRPPENWLRSGTQFQAHSTWLKGATTQFSSFNMAGTLPRTVGEVDVISASENIKKLLKIPFNKGQVSMAVHRIGRTLLIDELDLYQHLRTASQSERNWLKDVIYRTVEDERNLSTRRKTNETLQNWNLLSKFLHYSVSDSGEETPIPMPPRGTSSATPMPSRGSPTGTSSRDTVMVQHVPDPPHESKASEFARHVLWEFEDLRMLIGSDLPIFGGGKYPAVSLRLRDMNSPINVLTGMDYWLDNLMCNVPEIAMCYHLNGIVKKYELLKTEEIPHVENAQFSPRVVIDIAQNILSFIKSSCTKEGHTYWLYKGQNDDVVKLYDLTSLSMEPHGRAQDNPFVQPVALLLYRVAHAMSSSKPTKKDKGIICKLLKNCLALLEKDGNRNSELLASANCLLSHMLVSDEDLKQSSDGTPDGSSDDSSCDEDRDQDEEDEDGNVSQLTTMEVERLKLPSNGQGVAGDSKAVVPKILWDTKVERAKAALAYIVKGLRCIEYSSCDEKDSHDLDPKSAVHVGSPSRQLCYPEQAITDGDYPRNTKLRASSTELVSYSSRRRPGQLQRSGSESDGNGDKLKEDTMSASAQDMAVAQMAHPPGSWQYQSKMLLIRKARQIYSILAVSAVDARKYGKGLHCAKLAFACHCAFLAMQTQDTSDKPNPLSEILQACGDCHLLLTHTTSESHHHKEDYYHESDDDVYILQTTRKESSSKEYDWAAILNENKESGLQNSIQCYMEALNKAKEYNHDYLRGVGRKLGNAYNEQGVYYRNVSLELDTEEEQAPSAVQQDLWRKSYQSFESGVLAFEEVNDPTNIALLYCNIGQLMRVCAHAYATYGSGGSNGEFTQQEKHYYTKAADYYQKALGKVEQRRKNKPVWDSISWELSTTCFTMATLLQDHPPLSRMAQEQVEKVVLELMTKALTPCEMEDISSDRQPIYQYRAATIHHRLASMFHNSYRNQSSQQKQKHIRSLAELHYDKAIKLFKDLDHPMELLRVQLEKVALYEHVFQGQTGVGSRIKSLQSALDELLHCQDTVAALNKTTTEESSKTDDADKKVQDPQDVVSVASDRKENCGMSLQGKVISKQDRSIEDTTGNNAGRKVEKCNKAEVSKTNLDNSHVQDSGISLPGQSASETSECKGHDSVQFQSKDNDDDANVGVSSGNVQTTARTPSSIPLSHEYPCDYDRTETKDPVLSKATPYTDSSVRSETVTSRTEIKSNDTCRQSDTSAPSQHKESTSGITKEVEERSRLQGILRSRLQFVLLNLIKLHSGTKKGSHQLSNLKKMYAVSLSQPSSESVPSASTNANLASILHQIQALHK